MRLPLVVLSCGCGALLWATDFVVPSGTTVTTTQTLSTAGDEGVIEQGGAIIVLNQDGVEMDAANQSVLNAGTITLTNTLGNVSYGILSRGVAQSIVNTGTISVTASDSSCISSVDSGASIINSGALFASGEISQGIYSGVLNSILNSGTISVTGGLSSGVVLETSSTLVNSGTISATGQTSRGVYLFDPSTKLVNSGTISATGQGSRGVLIDGA